MLKLLVLTLILSSFVHAEWGRWQNFEQLISQNNDGEDYRLTSSFQNTKTLYLAIHGGNIERGTSELLRAIEDLHQEQNQFFSYYHFEGITAESYIAEILQSGDMHLTSHRFDDPLLLSMAPNYQDCLSLHGYNITETDICLGGNSERIGELEALLTEVFPEIRTCVHCCPPYLGQHENNVVNLCQDAGIQLEFSPQIRKNIIDDEFFRIELAQLLKDFF